MRRCASGRTSTRPTSRSTRRWRDTVGWVKPGRVATSSPAVRSPVVRASSRARLLGSATASKTSTPRVLHSVYIDTRLYRLGAALNEEGLRTCADEPLPVEDVGGGDADAIGPDRASCPQREVIADRHA